MAQDDDPNADPAPPDAAKAPAGQKLAAARDLAKAARESYAKLEQEYGNVPGAEAEVGEARRVAAMTQGEREEMGTLSLVAIGILGIGFYGAVGLGIAAAFSTRVRALWVDYWHWALLGAALAGLLLFAARQLEAWLRTSTEDTARRVLAISAIGFIVLAILGLIGFGAANVALAAQLIIIVVTALLPAVVYFLFIATRRPSILNEFISNLARLGLLGARPVRADATESAEERRARVGSYFQRFEAIYGTLRFEAERSSFSRRDLVLFSRKDLVHRLIAAVDARIGTAPVAIPEATILIGDIFHANLIIPIGLVTILTTLGWLLALQPALNQPDTAVVDLVPKPTALNFAFLGAYFFGIQMLFRRFVRRDLGPNAYFAFANRIILAIIAVWVVLAVYPAFRESQSEAVAETAHNVAAAAGLVPPDAAPSGNASAGAPANTSPDAPVNASPGAPINASAGAPANASSPGAAANRTPPATPPGKPESGVGEFVDDVVTTLGGSAARSILLLAFIIGVFPRMLWQILAAAATRMLYIKLVLPSVEAKQPLYQLDGLTVWHETRLEEEDVENVPNMASCDIVELMLHTQIPIERLVSWIDQAILLTLLGPADDETRAKLRGLGLRMATQVVEASKNAENGGDALTAALGADRARALVMALQKEGNFDIVRAWRRV